MHRVQVTARLAGVLAMSCLSAYADDGGWHHEFAPYVWGSGMSGEAGVGPVEADVDLSFGDILDNLEIGGMAAYRGQNDRWAVMVDAIYMALEAKKTGPQGLLQGEADVDQIGIEADLAYRALENFEVFAGVRYNDIESEVQVSGPLGNTLSAKADESWVDPLAGARFSGKFGTNWGWALRADLGGFGVGSDLAWQVMGSVRWQLSERMGIVAAYRYLDTDYEDGSGAGYFKYDIAASGPGLGAVFSF